MIFTQRAFNDFIVVYFVILIIIGAFFLVNLTLAVIKAKFTDTIGRSSKEVLQEGYLEELQKLLSADEDQQNNAEQDQVSAKEVSKDQSEAEISGKLLTTIEIKKPEKVEKRQSKLKSQFQRQESTKQIKPRRNSMLIPAVKPQQNTQEKRRQSKFYQLTNFQGAVSQQNTPKIPDPLQLPKHKRRATVADLNFQIIPIIQDPIQEENTQVQNQSQLAQEEEEEKKSEESDKSEQSSQQSSNQKKKFHVITELEVKKNEKSVASNPALLNKLGDIFSVKKTQQFGSENSPIKGEFSPIKNFEKNSFKQVDESQKESYSHSESLIDSVNTSFNQGSSARKANLNSSSFIKTSRLYSNDNFENILENPSAKQNNNPAIFGSTFSSTHFGNQTQTESTSTFFPDINNRQNRMEQNFQIGKSKFKMQEIMNPNRKFQKYSPITTASNTPKSLDYQFLSSLQSIQNIKSFVLKDQNKIEGKVKISQVAPLNQVWQRQSILLGSETELSYLLEDISSVELSSSRKSKTQKNEKNEKNESNERNERKMQREQRQFQFPKIVIQKAAINNTSDQSQMIQKANSPLPNQYEQSSPIKSAFGLKLLEVLANNRKVNVHNQSDKYEISAIGKLIIAGQSNKIKKILQKKKDDLGKNVKAKFQVKKNKEIVVNSQEDVQNVRDSDHASDLVQTEMLKKKQINKTKSISLTYQESINQEQEWHKFAYINEEEKRKREQQFKKQTVQNFLIIQSKYHNLNRQTKINVFEDLIGYKFEIYFDSQYYDQYNEGEASISDICRKLPENIINQYIHSLSTIVAVV